MSLIKCRDCGKEISDQAGSCPNCGCPVQPFSPESKPEPTTKKAILKESGMGVVALLMSFTGCLTLIGLILAIIDLIKKDKTKSHTCSKVAIVICIIFTIIGFIIVNLPKIPEMESTGATISEEPTPQPRGTWFEFSPEEEDAILTVFIECDINDLKSVKLFSTGEDQTSYYVSTSQVNNIVVWIDNDSKKVNSIYFNDYDIYLDGEVKSKITDYYMTDDQKAGFRVIAEELVTKMLVSPSTAKFAPTGDWRYGKEEGVYIIQGYVDSQNSFSAMIRTEFQISFKDDKMTSFIVDGIEQIK